MPIIRVFLEGCNIIAESKSKKAFQVQHRDRLHWLAKSQIDDPQRLEVGDQDVTIGIPEWLAEKIGVEGD